MMGEANNYGGLSISNRKCMRQPSRAGRSVVALSDMLASGRSESQIAFEKQET